MENTKRLYRSRTSRQLGGVCGGLGEYFNIDPTLVRLAFVVLMLWGGAALPLYVVMWIIIPEAPFDEDASLN
jgi:phage shock protein C